jgi:hypothetical protein
MFPPILPVEEIVSPLFSAASLTMSRGEFDRAVSAELETLKKLRAISNVVAPSCLQARVDQGQSLSSVALMPLKHVQTAGRKLRTTLAFMCGVGREGILMPSWDPHRRKVAGGAPPVKQG